ncbi:MAG: FKBP-type peptidyl-prolyl cis-trans isomerase [Fibrobacterota bacterium]
MKVFLTTAVILALGLSFTSCKKGSPASTGELKTPGNRLSYALGIDIGNSLKDLKGEVDLPSFYRGIEDLLNGKTPQLTTQQAMEIKKESFQRIQMEQAEKAKKSGDTFLEENKKKPGVVVTASGLQYLAERQGSGPKPIATDKVKVHYKGTLVDGKPFDSSYDRGQPVEFMVGGVIPGWSEALLLMPVGSKYKLFVPAQLGYGERSPSPTIPPNSVLLFDVELLEIVK